MVTKTLVNQHPNDCLHFGQKVGNAQIRCWSDLLASSFPQKYPQVWWKSLDSFRDGDLTGKTAKRPLWGVGYRRCYCAAFKFKDGRQRAAAFVRRKRSRSNACFECGPVGGGNQTLRRQRAGGRTAGNSFGANKLGNRLTIVLRHDVLRRGPTGEP